MEHPDGTGVSGVPGQGPFLVIQIRTDGKMITDAAFQSHTCGVTVACGSILTELLIGRSLTAAPQLTPDDIVTALGSIPIEKQHVPESAIRALQQALKEALQ